MEPNSHDTFEHDSMDSLSYDWERIANPDIEPQHPFKVYLPRNTADVVAAIKETNALKQTLRVRSKGHSSNDLVLEKGGNILCTDKLNRILEHDFSKLTVRLQSGVVLAEVDKHLARFKLGLPVIGDNNHITAGGFASVGGISPASHRFGLFVDNVLEIEYVDWSGTVHRCSRQRQVKRFNRILTGTGRHGVITELTCKLYRVEKFGTIIENESKLFLGVDSFIDFSEKRVTSPGKSLFHRGMWVDFPRGQSSILIGQYCNYITTEQSPLARRRKELAYGYLHFLGRWAGNLPDKVDEVVKLLGILGVVLLPPRYGTINDVESLTDRVIDYSVGEPSRMLTVLTPVEKYRETFERIYGYCKRCRETHQAITGISIYVKPIVSDYLKAKTASGHFIELTFLLFIKPGRMTAEILDGLVKQIDTQCIELGALRYMPTKTSKDESIRRQIDPNYRYPQG